MRRRHTFYLSLGLLGYGMSACSAPPTPNTNSDVAQPTTRPPNPSLSQLAGGQEITIQGAGASFPQPLYQKWGTEFNKIYPNVRFNYQSVGSGAGIKQFIAGLVDVGASDIPILDRDMAKVGRGVLMLPLTGGALVLSYNLGNITNLYLSRASYINILAGRITRWNDPAISKDNPNLSLPDLDILLLHRSDESGTTEILTRHLSAISKEWRDSLGTGRTVTWRRGLGVRGSEGVVAEIQGNLGSIGYVEYGYAVQNKLSTATLENRAGRAVTPAVARQTSALSRIRLENNLVGIDPDPLGGDSYPIVAYTWLLVYRDYPTPNRGTVIQTFLRWALTQGQAFSPELGYIPLPENVVSQVQAAIDQIRVV